MDKQKLRKKIGEKRTDSNNTTHTTMGTLEDVEGRGSFEAMGLFHYVWLSEGQPLAKANPAEFSPKAQGSCSRLPGLRRCSSIFLMLAELGD